MTSRRRGERGIAALEFALIAPLLLGLVLGAIEFGERYSTRASYNNAALVAARSYALSNSSSAATAAARNAGIPSSVTPTFAFAFDGGGSASSCSPASDGTYPNVTVTLTRTGIPAPTPVAGLLPGASATYTATGRAVVRCAV